MSTKAVPSFWRAGAWVIPGAVLVVALALRLGLQLLVGFYEDPVRWEYDVIARNIVEGRGYYYEFLGTRWLTFGLPALPLLDAALYTISDGFAGIGLALASFSAITACLASLVALRLHGRSAAVLAGAAVAFHPGQLVFSSQIHEMALETFALALTLVVLLAELERPTSRTLAASACCAALAVFVRPTYGVFVLVALFVIVIRRPAFAWRRAVIVLAAMILLTAPWTARTAAALGGPQGTLPYSCLALWIGNNPYASGSSLDVSGRSWWDVQPEANQERIWGQPEIVQGRIFCEEASAFLAADPLRTLGWWSLKATWYWWVSPQAGQLYPDFGLRVYMAVWLVAASLALVGAATLWFERRRHDLAVLIALYMTISLGQSFAYVDGRHRMEIEWAVIILSAIGAVTVARWMTKVVFRRGPLSSLAAS